MRKYNTVNLVPRVSVLPVDPLKRDPGNEAVLYSEAMPNTDNVSMSIAVMKAS